MSKNIFMLSAAVLVLFLSACSHKPMSDKAKKEAVYNAIINTSYISKGKANELLKETETNIGTDEFSKITSITDVLQNVDAIVCYSAMDGTDYYALYTYVNSMFALVRIRRDNLMDGDLVYTRGMYDCRAYIKSADEKGCRLVLENWNGTLMYEEAFKLEALTDDGEWETVSEVSGLYRKKIGQVSKEFDLAWYADGESIPEGRYRLTLPVLCFRSKWDENIWDYVMYNESIKLSCEFDIEQKAH
jgi:hypothetical protein